jgi:hypothetical protein
MLVSAHHDKVHKVILNKYLCKSRKAKNPQLGKAVWFYACVSPPSNPYIGANRNAKSEEACTSLWVLG